MWPWWGWGWAIVPKRNIWQISRFLAVFSVGMGDDLYRSEDKFGMVWYTTSPPFFVEISQWGKVVNIEVLCGFSARIMGSDMYLLGFTSHFPCSSLFSPFPSLHSLPSPSFPSFSFLPFPSYLPFTSVVCPSPSLLYPSPFHYSISSIVYACCRYCSVAVVFQFCMKIYI